MIKRLFLSISFVALLIVFGASLVRAQSIADLQAQIQALLSQVTALQAQLKAAEAPPVSTSLSPDPAPSSKAATLPKEEPYTPYTSPSAVGKLLPHEICDFTRSLFIGIRGEDVRCLQKFLNINSHSVANSGPGSSGNETDYFGPRTRTAVHKFQLEHFIKPDSGYFGPISRAKYKELVDKNPTPVAIPKTENEEKQFFAAYKKVLEKQGKLDPSNTLSPPDDGSPFVVSLAPRKAGVGTSVVVQGRNFTESDNEVLFNGISIASGLSSTDGQSLTFTVPNVTLGAHNLTVKNARGISIESKFIVLSDAQKTPRIFSITPSSGGPGTLVTLKGEGFTRSNTLLLGYDILYGVSSSDGTTLTYTFDPPPFASNLFGDIDSKEALLEVLANEGQTFEGLLEAVKDDFPIYVVNENGETGSGHSFKGWKNLPAHIQ